MASLPMPGYAQPMQQQSYGTPYNPQRSIAPPAQPKPGGTQSASDMRQNWAGANRGQSGGTSAWQSTMERMPQIRPGTASPDWAQRMQSEKRARDQYVMANPNGANAGYLSSLYAQGVYRPDNVMPDSVSTDAPKSSALKPGQAPSRYDMNSAQLQNASYFADLYRRRGSLNQQESSELGKWLQDRSYMAPQFGGQSTGSQSGSSQFGGLPFGNPGMAQPIQQPSLGTPYTPGQQSSSDPLSALSQQYQSQSPSFWQQVQQQATPKQQLMQWGAQQSQIPWGPNYGNAPESRPDPWSQQITGPFGNDQQAMWDNIGGFIQAANNQSAQKPVGTYLGQGNPGPSYGKQNYDPSYLMQQGQNMLQGGWKNPFAQQSPSKTNGSTPWLWQA